MMPKIRARHASAASAAEPVEPQRQTPLGTASRAHAPEVSTFAGAPTEAAYKAATAIPRPDSKVRMLIDELERNWSELESWTKDGNEEMAAYHRAEISGLLGHIYQSGEPGNRVPEGQENVPPQSSLRTAERMTADEAADRIQEFNALFSAPDFDFNELRGQNFTRAPDQSAVEKKLRGKGIGPFYLNDKGDKMLAADRDAHGGGTFKYFKKVSNQWVRQHTLDHAGRPFRS